MPNKFDTNQWINGWSTRQEMTPLPERSKPKESESDPNEQNWFTRAMLGSIIAENAPVATAMGYRIKPNGDVVQEDTPESRQLAKNLAVIGAAGATGMALPYVVGAATNPVNIETAKAVGKNLLQGAFDYTLADGAVRAVTGKDIMTNVNDGVKQVFGNNKYTNFATQYVTPFAPIPVFGTGNFTKNIMTAGKNAVQMAKQYPELLYQIDKAALKVLDKTGYGEQLLNKDYKWLNRQIPFYNTIMDYKIPKQFRKDVVKTLNEYNKKQLERMGLSDKHRDWDFKIIPVSIKEQLINTFKKDNDNFRALAETFGDKIQFYVEGLDNRYNPMGSMIHEARHSISPSGLKNIKTANMRIEDGAVRGDADFEHPLFPASYRLASKTNRKSAWHQKLDEFDAELANWRGLDTTPYHMMDDLSKARIKRLASERFGISEDDADFIATQLSINGYKSGGKINQAE